MNLFCKCINCKIPVVITSLDPFCPFCKKPIKNIEDGHSDGFSFFIEEYKEKQYFDWEDIQKLIYTVDYLTEINNKICRELGKALIELDKTKDRLEWYRSQLLKEIKI